MNEGSGSAKPKDPLEAMREARDAYLGGMSKVMIDAVNSEAYAEATGAMLDGCLTLAQPIQEAVNKAILQGLAQMSLPSRQDIAALALRFTHIEMRLDDMEAKLDRITQLVAEAHAATGTAPGARPQEAKSSAPRKTASAVARPAAKRVTAAKKAPARRQGSRKG